VTNLLQFLLTGILVGGVYALIALGLVLIYKSSRVFNFAQGDLVMLGGFITWTLLAQFGLPLWASLPVALALAWVVGLLVERLALRPLIGQPILAVSPQIGRLFPILAANILAALGPMLFGLVIILFLIFEPRGLAHRWELFKASYRLHPFAH